MPLSVESLMPDSSKVAVREAVGQSVQLEIAYIAGFFDGEGTVGAYYRNVQIRSGWSGKRITIALLFYNCNKYVLECIQASLGVGKVFTRPTYSPNHKVAYYLRISGFEDIVYVLDLLILYLVVKKDVAILVRELAVSRLLATRLDYHAPFTQPEIALVGEIGSQNRRGKDAVSS